MAEQFGTYHLADNSDLYELQRNNMFELIVYGIDSLLRAGTSTEQDSDYIEDGQDRIRLTVKKVSFPNFKQGTLKVNRGNTIMKAAGTMSFDDGSIEVYDYIGADGRSVLQAWQRLSGDIVTEKVGRMSEYKKNCTLVEMTSDAEVVKYWDIKGAWVSSVSNDAYDATTGDSERSVTATIVFDRMIPRVA